MIIKQTRLQNRRAQKSNWAENSQLKSVKFVSRKKEDTIQKQIEFQFNVYVIHAIL